MDDATEKLVEAVRQRDPIKAAQLEARLEAAKVENQKDAIITTVALFIGFVLFPVRIAAISFAVWQMALWVVFPRFGFSAPAFSYGAALVTVLVFRLLSPHNVRASHDDPKRVIRLGLAVAAVDVIAAGLFMLVAWMVR